MENPNEAELDINGIKTKALLDTGSCVSVISVSFVKENLPQATLQKIERILNIECADGSQLPYLGYIEADIKIPYGVSGSNEKRCLLLVVPETVYSKQIPIILGTNILQEYMSDCKQEFGQQFLQKAKLYTP